MKFSKFLKKIDDLERSNFTISDFFEKMCHWVRFNLYAYIYFFDILPLVLIDKLNQIFPNRVGLGSDGVSLRGFLIDSVASKVIEKLKKPYSNEEIPTIISVSLALLPEGPLVHGVFKHPDIAYFLQEAILKHAKIAIEGSDLYLMSSLPDEKSLSNKYKDTYIFIRGGNALYYINSMGKPKPLKIDSDRFNQIRINNVNESEPLKNRASKEIVNKLWELIKINKGHARLEERSLKSLYAIIIDTTWYNWFPDIIEKSGDGHFPNDYKNCYYILYNKSISEDLQCEPRIFDSLVNTQFEIFLELESSLSLEIAQIE